MPKVNAYFNSVTVLEHLKFFAKLKGIPQNMQESLIQGVIKKLKIEKHQHKTAETLSGGNKRKLQVAMAILGNP